MSIWFDHFWQGNYVAHNESRGRHFPAKDLPSAVGGRVVTILLLCLCQHGWRHGSVPSMVKSLSHKYMCWSLLEGRGSCFLQDLPDVGVMEWSTAKIRSWHHESRRTASAEKSTSTMSQSWQVEKGHPSFRIRDFFQWPRDGLTSW